MTDSNLEFNGYQCAICWNIYRIKDNLNKHQSRTHHGGQIWVRVFVFVIPE